MCLGASFRAGVNYAGGERPISDPAGYQDKACFYIFNYTIEIIVVFFYVVVRVDKRFYVPDGAKKAGDYLGQGANVNEVKDEERTGEGTLERVVSDEETMFDRLSPEEVEERERKGGDLEKGADRGRTT